MRFDSARHTGRYFGGVVLLVGIVLGQAVGATAIPIRLMAGWIRSARS